MMGGPRRSITCFAVVLTCFYHGPHWSRSFRRRRSTILRASTSERSSSLDVHLDCPASRASPTKMVSHPGPGRNQSAIPIGIRMVPSTILTTRQTGVLGASCLRYRYLFSKRCPGEPCRRTLQSFFSSSNMPARVSRNQPGGQGPCFNENRPLSRRRRT